MDAVPSPRIDRDPPSALIYRLAGAMEREAKARREAQDAGAAVRAIAVQLAPALPAGCSVRVMVPQIGQASVIIELQRTVTYDDRPGPANVLARYVDTLYPTDLAWPEGTQAEPEPADVAVPTF